MILPLVLIALLGGALLARSARTAAWPGRPTPTRRLGRRPDDAYPVFTEAPQKTYHLAAIVKGRTPGGRARARRTRALDAAPVLRRAGRVHADDAAICVALALVVDAPLKELANPLVPENPAKAPWYFLGLQELVSFSAFMGGIGIPTIVLLGLGLIPFLDRETAGTGDWFGGPGGRPLVLRPSCVGFGAALARRGLRHPLRLAPRVVPERAAAGRSRSSIRARC